MVRLQTCCCFSLRTGALLIGYLNIVSTMCFVFSTIIHLASTTSQNELFKTTVIVTLTVSFLDLLVVSIMVYGVHKGKPSYLFAWLALDFLALSASTLLVIILSGQVLLTGTAGPQYAVIFVVTPVMLGLAWYLFLVVYSHYKELCEDPILTPLQNKTTYNYPDDHIVIVSKKKGTDIKCIQDAYTY